MLVGGGGLAALYILSIIAHAQTELLPQRTVWLPQETTCVVSLQHNLHLANDSADIVKMFYSNLIHFKSELSHESAVQTSRHAGDMLG